MARLLPQVLFRASAVICLLIPGAIWAQDPPSRVARLNYIQGPVSMEPAGTDGWTAAVINRPLTTDDYLWTDEGGRAELHLDNSVIRLNSRTSFGFLNLDDRTVQIKLAQGEIELHVRDLASDENYEIDTPNAAVALVQPGDYRLIINPDEGVTSVIVRRGDAQISGGGQSFDLPSGQSVRLIGDQSLSYDIEPAPGRDSFEQFCVRRDIAEARAAEQARYVPPEVVGYEDLAEYGDWRSAPEYGYVWYPRVSTGWAPYRMGHWAWIDPWGWTWVDDAPWGFAPFHYGRWAFIGGGWGWIPCRPRIRPVYAPALVAFLGGSGFSLSLAFGHGPAVGWVPLGPGEVYAPAYNVSPVYFRQVNVTNTVVNKSVNITNAYNNYYVNRTNNVNVTNVNNRFVNARVNNAVTVMPSQAFAAGRPVTAAGRPLPATELAQLRTVPVAITPPVAPTRQAVAPPVRNVPAPQPPPNVTATKVVARTTPPPPVPPFQARQQLIEQNGGRPLSVEQLRQLSARQAPATPAVRPVPPPPGQPARVQVGGNPPAGQIPQQGPGRVPATVRPPATVENEQTNPTVRIQPRGTPPTSEPPVNRGVPPARGIQQRENRQAIPQNQQPQLRRQQPTQQEDVRPQQQDRYRQQQDEELRQQQQMRQRQIIEQQQMQQQRGRQEQDQVRQQQMREQQRQQEMRQQEVRPSRPPEPPREQRVEQAPRQDRPEQSRPERGTRDRQNQ